MVEEIRQVFPDLKEAQVLKKIDFSHKKYATEIGILKKSGQLTDISSNITWTLPTDCKEVIDITFYDSSDMPLYMDDLGLCYEIVFGKLTFLNEDQTALSNLPSDITYVYIDYVYNPATIDDVTDSLEVDEELHEYVLADVWRGIYASFPIDTLTREGVRKVRDWGAVRYWKDEYRDGVKKGKMRAAVNKDATDGDVKLDTLGNPIRLARQRISTSTLVEVSGLRAIYSKYIRFTAVSPSTITITEQFGWTTTIATPTVASNIITVVSSAEFSATMTAITNIGIRHERTSTSAWEFEVYDDWGTLQVEIYER
jgi:hypothetical protein